MPVCAVEAVVGADSGLFDVAETIAGWPGGKIFSWAVDCRAVSVASTSFRGRGSLSQRFSPGTSLLERGYLHT